MTEPVWEGEGEDPWASQRLEAQAGFTVGERTVYDDYYAHLASWMVLASQAINSGAIPDPVQVWSVAPEWVQGLDEFVYGSIGELMGASYRRIFGEGYRYDQRPFVDSYLAQARNRLVHFPDQVYSLIAREVSLGAGMGESIPEIRDRIQKILSMTDTPRWPNRATVVARTETVGSLNAGRFDSFRAVSEDLGGDFERMWLATSDERTRPTHMEADGQRVPMNAPFMVGGFPLWFPGDPSGPAHEVIQCRCTSLLVRPGETIDLTNRQFWDI